MLSFLKKSLMKRCKGTLLIEVLAAVLVLSVGILTVMEVFAVQSRGARRSQQKTREIFVMADNLGAVLAGVDLDRLEAADAKDQGTVRVSEETLRGDKDGLKEVTLLFEGPGVSRQKGMGVVTYVENDASAL